MDEFVFDCWGSGNYVTKVTTQLDDYAAEISKDCGLPAIQVAAILSGAFAEFTFT